jgi:hypothetical protein
VVSSAAECTHFVADKFVRTGNMLEAMASAKPVVDIGWLQACSEANGFVPEAEFILRDAKKEEELGFSMVFTLHEALRKPLLQVPISPCKNMPIALDSRLRNGRMSVLRRNVC